MHLEDERGTFGDCSGVILQMGLVGGTNLHEPGPGSFKDFGDAESAPDLDQFAATDDDLVLFRRDEAAEGENEGGGTVVDGSGGFGFEEDGECRFEVAGALAPFPIEEVEFEIGVTGSHLAQGVGCPLTEGGPSQVGVNEDPSGVDDRLQAGGGKGLKA